MRNPVERGFGVKIHAFRSSPLCRLPHILFIFCNLLLLVEFLEEGDQIRLLEMLASKL